MVKVENMEGRNESIYPNPPNMPFVALGAFTSIIVVIASALYYYWTGRAELAVLMGLVGMMIFLFVGWIEYVHRPNGLGISENCIILHHRFGKDIAIPIDKVVMIYFHTGDIRTFLGRFNNNGAIYISGRTYAPIKVSPELAKLVQKGFVRRMGHYPEQYPGSDG